MLHGQYFKSWISYSINNYINIKILINSMVKTITVKDETWEKLTIKKIKEKFKSLDELINCLLEKDK